MSTAERAPHPQKSADKPEPFRMVNTEAPRPPQGPTPAETEKIRRRSKWGIMLARIGSEWAFVDPQAATDEYGRKEDKPVRLQVRDLGRFPAASRAPLKCKCLHCDITTDSRESMEQAHIDRFGNAKAMEAKGIAHVWAYWSDVIHEYTVRDVDAFAQPKLTKVSEPIGFLSDRSMTDD